MASAIATAIARARPIILPLGLPKISVRNAYNYVANRVTSLRNKPKTHQDRVHFPSVEALIDCQPRQDELRPVEGSDTAFYRPVVLLRRSGKPQNVLAHYFKQNDGTLKYIQFFEIGHKKENPS